MTRFLLKGDRAIFYPVGELDHASAAILKEDIDRFIEEHPKIRHVVLDFEKLTFMDSSGIGAILGRYRRIVSRGGSLSVCNVNACVDRIMALSGVYSLIDKIQS